MGFCDVTNAEVFALTRRRRAERQAWLKAHIGGVAYWGTQEAADAAAARYAEWVRKGKPPSPEAPRKRPSGNLFLVPSTLPRLARRLFRLQGQVCYLTGEPFTRMNPPTWEHVVPKSKGGTNFRNRLLAGQYANNKKGNRAPYPCELLYLEAIYLLLDAETAKTGG